MTINKRKRDSWSPVVSSTTNNNNSSLHNEYAPKHNHRNLSPLSQLSKCQKRTSFIEQAINDSLIKGLSPISFDHTNTPSSITDNNNDNDINITRKNYSSSPCKKVHDNNLSNSSSSLSMDSTESVVSRSDSCVNLSRQFSNSSLPSNLNDTTSITSSDPSSSMTSTTSVEACSSLTINTSYKSVKPLQSAFNTSGLLSKHHQQDNLSTYSFTNSPVPLANSSSLFIDHDNNNSNHVNSHSLKKIIPDTPCKPAPSSFLKKNNGISKNKEISLKKIVSRSFIVNKSIQLENNSTDNFNQNGLLPMNLDDNNDDFVEDQENRNLIHSSSFNIENPNYHHQNIPNSSSFTRLNSKSSIGAIISTTINNMETEPKPERNITKGLLFFQNVNTNNNNVYANTISTKKHIPVSLKLDSSFTKSFNLNDNGTTSPYLGELCSPLSPSNNAFAFANSIDNSKAVDDFFQEDLSSPVTSKFMFQNYKKMVSNNNTSINAKAKEKANSVSHIVKNGNNCNNTGSYNNNRYSLMRSCSVENYFGQHTSSSSTISQQPLKTPKTPMFSLESGFDDDSIFLSNKFGNENVEMIGKGEFSKVYKVNFKSRTYAIKQLISNNKKSGQLFKSKNSIQINTKLNSDPISKFLSVYSDYKLTKLEEVQLLNYIKERQNSRSSDEYFYSKLIIDYIDYFNHDNTDYIIMNHYPNGSLSTFLLSQKDRKIPEFTTWKIFLNLLEALSFLHSENILHLDLKPDNIFINSSNNLTIADFGMSIINNSNNSKSSVKLDREGDRVYIAPEIINSNIYSSAADIFALGLIILEISADIYLPNNGDSWQKLRNGDLSDASPISEKRKGNTRNTNENLENLDFVNDGYSLESVVKLMICPNFQKRIKADTLLELPYFTFIKSFAEMGSTVTESKYIFIK